MFDDTEGRYPSNDTNAPALPVLTLAKVKYAKFASHETDCFEALLLVDGKPFCHVSNEGMGGANHWLPVKGGPSISDLRAAMLPIAQRFNPKTMIDPPRPIAGWFDAEKMVEQLTGIGLSRPVALKQAAESLPSGQRDDFVSWCEDRATGDDDAEIADDWYMRGHMEPETFFEGIVGRLLDEHLQSKHIARLLKKTLVVFTTKAKVLTFTPKKGGTVDGILPKVQALQYERGDPVVKVLNRIPLEEAVRIVLAHAPK